MRPGLLLGATAGPPRGLFIHQTSPASVSTLKASLRPWAVFACFSPCLCGHPSQELMGVGRGSGAGVLMKRHSSQGSHLVAPSLSHTGKV